MKIPRLHLFEIHEQAWLPNSIRNGVTDALFTVWKTCFWRNTLPHLFDLLQHSKGNRIIDLCSGAGGPMPLVLVELKMKFPDLSILLSDLNPYTKPDDIEIKNAISYHKEPVDAMSVPKNFGDARTLFEGFHHFKPEQAVAILKDAVKAKQPIAVFEFQRREFWDSIRPTISYALFIGAFFNIFFTPFRWTKLIFTIIPVIPFILVFDGIVSVLRTYTANELAGLAVKAGTENYKWEVRETEDRGKGRMTCLIGWPAERGGVSIVKYT